MFYFFTEKKHWDSETSVNTHNIKNIFYIPSLKRNTGTVKQVLTHNIINKFSIPPLKRNTGTLKEVLTLTILRINFLFLHWKKKHRDTKRSKCKTNPITYHEEPEGEQNFTVPLTSTLDWVGGQRHVPAALSPARDPVPHVKDAVWGPRAGLEGSCETRLNGIRSPKSPPRSESLYGLSYWNPDTGTLLCIVTCPNPHRLNF